MGFTDYTKIRVHVEEKAITDKSITRKQMTRNEVNMIQTASNGY